MDFPSNTTPSSPRLLTISGHFFEHCASCGPKSLLGLATAILETPHPGSSFYKRGNRHRQVREGKAWPEPVKDRVAPGSWPAPGALPQTQAARLCPVIGQEPGTQLEVAGDGGKQGRGAPSFLPDNNKHPTGLYQACF